MNPENPEHNNEILETPEVQQPEQPELMSEREEVLETEPLYETTQEYSRLKYINGAAYQNIITIVQQKSAAFSSSK